MRYYDGLRVHDERADELVKLRKYNISKHRYEIYN